MLRDSLEHRVLQVHQGHRVLQVRLVCRGRLEQQVQQGPQVCQDALELLVALALQVLLELLVYQEETASQEVPA